MKDFHKDLIKNESLPNNHRQTIKESNQPMIQKLFSKF